MTEGRMRPLQRQDGFNVPNAASSSGSHSSDMKLASPSNDTPYNGRIRTTTGDTIVRATDGDVEMGDEKRGIMPLPIPGSSANGTSAHTGSMNELPTPPDESLMGAAEPSNGKTSASPAIVLSSPHARALAPRLSALASSHASSGPASFSSQFSQTRGSDPKYYSLSGQPYSNASMRPYLSTSFQTSDERGSSRDRMRHPRGIDDMDDDDDEAEDDVFGNIGGSLGLRKPAEPSPPRHRQSGEMPREEGDAAGVFDFSSPCFGPKSMGTSDVPPLSPRMAHDEAQRQASRVMSPSWTAATLGRLSLGGSSVDHSPAQSAGSAAGPRRPPYPSSPRRSHVSTAGITSGASGSHSPYSRSLPSGNHGLQTSAQQRRLSHNRRPQHMPANSFHFSPTIRPRNVNERARSTSRHRNEAARSSVVVKDDDETDEDNAMADEEDDDATEDEAESKFSVGQAKPIARPNGSLGLPPRHASGQVTTMSASYERAQNGLSRQFSSDRHNHLSVGRHHPYAASPSGASAGNGSLLAHSPNNARAGFDRRSSFGNNAGLGASPSNGVYLSTSPRFSYGMPGREAYQQGAPYGMHPHVQLFGSSPDARAYHDGRYVPQESHDDDGDEADDDEEEGYGQIDEDEEEEDERSNVRKKPAVKQPRASSSSRAAAANGEVDTPEMAEVNAIRDRLGGAANCSAFISKLWYLMCRPQLYSKYIHWSESGDSVILINDPDINNEFAAAVLPKLFKHGNNASFVRQLNLYGFQRVPSSRLLDAAEVDAARRLPHGASISTALQLYGPHSSFAHPRFKKDQESMLPSMKPRSSKKPKKSGGADGGAHDDGDE